MFFVSTSSSLSVVSTFNLALTFLLPFLVTEETIEAAAGLPKNQFFPYGYLSVDEYDDTLGQMNDGVRRLETTEEFILFDKAYTNVTISINGILSFGAAPLMKENFFADLEELPFNNSVPIVAPFWADVDTTPGQGGDILFRVTNNSTAVNKARAIIADAFADFPNFIATQLIIVTWDEVGYYELNTDLVNTFQCVIATDGSNTFAIFLYHDIQWTAGDDRYNNDTQQTMKGTRAIVGFDAGDGVHFKVVNGSFTEDIGKIEERTNVGVTGMFVFQINELFIRSPDEDENCPIIGTSACDNRLLRVACRYFNMTKTSIPRPCQEIISS